MKILAFPAFRNHSSNPYNYLLYKAVEDIGVTVTEFTSWKALVEQYDLIHVHWPEWYLSNSSALKAFINSSILLLSLAWAKLRGKKVVWTVHNLRPHFIKHPLMSRFFWFIFKRMVDATISLSEANKKLFLEANESFSNRHNGVTYHGLYTNIYKNDVNKNVAINTLGLASDASACLFLGQLKPYKNIECLINLFLNEEALQERVLLIAGKFDSSEYREIIVSQIASAKNIRLFEGFVDDDDLQYFFAAADFTILPFKNIFNSGSALLSASFDVPVLIPESDNFREYAGLLPGLICPYKGELNSTLIIDSFNKSEVSNSSENIGMLQWPSIAQLTSDFYTEVLS